MKKRVVEQAGDEPPPDPWIETLLEYAADAVRALTASKSRRKFPEPSGTLRGLAGPIEGRILKVSELGYKRPRGGQEFSKHRPSRFFMDPNKVAAAIAVRCIEDWRQVPVSGPKRRAPYKVPRGDGSMSNTHDLAAEYAVELVNKHYIHLLPRSRNANVESVKELLRRGRTDWPAGNDHI